MDAGENGNHTIMKPSKQGGLYGTDTILDFFDSRRLFTFGFF